MGTIQKILTDNGTQFTNHKWKEKLKELNIKPVFTTTYHPEGNSVKRANRDIGRILRTYCHDKHTNWTKGLESAEYWINNTTHYTTGYTPNQILFGKTNTLIANKVMKFPEQPEETQEHIIQMVKTNIYTKAEKRTMKFDNGKKFITYQPGQQTLVKDHKLSSATDKVIHKFFMIFKGPYTITQIHPNNTIEAKDQYEKQHLFNMKNVKRYYPPEPGEINKKQ